MGALVEKHPGFTIRGSILTLDLANGEMAFFNGYTPQETIFNGLMKRAEATWSDYQKILSNEEVELKI